jgi:RNA polymerase subunit RPABC4/transcription elongation factor Spt4
LRAMKTCPVCQQALRLNVPVCPYCGHKFIAAIVWILLMAIAFVVIAGVLLFLTRS